ncbi:MAG: ATP-binding protein [Campylobacterota bacterium]|nr:ATP-binding protein [Campylobacterota bacterium]
MKLKLGMILIFTIVYTIILYMTTYTKDERIQIALEKHVNVLQTHYDVTMDYFMQDVKSIQSNVENNKKVIELFSQAQNVNEEQRASLRTELHALLSPMYQRLQTRGIHQFQFVFPNNISFLRMHKPDRYGDDLTNIRYSYQHTNKTKKITIGFEQGRTTHAFRYVFPYYDKNGNHLGAAEVSLAAYALQNKFFHVNKIHSHFLVNKDIFDVKAWEEKYLIQEYIPSIEHQNYMFTINEHYSKKRMAASKINIIAPLKDKIDFNINQQIPFALHAPYKSTMKIVTFLPIVNAQGDRVSAYIVSYTDDGTIYNICQDYKYTNMILFITLLLLFYFIYRNLNHKYELEIEVQKQTQELKENEYELQYLNENLEQKIIIEVDKNKHIQEKLFESEKMASMGEMIGNIAHQWRQPLSVISSAATGMRMQKEYDVLTDKEFNNTCDIINDNAQYLSKTIDDFRNFIKGDRVKKQFNLEDNLQSFLHLIQGSVTNHYIKIVLDTDRTININGYENELIQCFINIFNNAKDALKENIEENRLIFITTSVEEKTAVISFKDNAGGIPQDISHKIFEPYFSTKHQSQGTGLGLHMTYKLIVDGMGGSIEAHNVTYTHEGVEYTGAQFTLTLPMD